LELPGMISGELKEACEELVHAAGFDGADAIDPIVGGANNRVYRVEAGGKVLALKVYYRDADDQRDRLASEFEFSRFAWDKGIRSLPCPRACDRTKQMGLYEFVPGRRLEPGQVDADAVRQALEFYHELNRRASHPEAAALGDAAEACFSIRAHVECVERRIRRLGQLEGETAIDREAREFIHGDLQDSWDAVSRSILRELNGHLDVVSSKSERRLSPSDFGYHNALLELDGRFRFLDFEYAGWDDPAKLVCDFFCQPAVPVPMEYLGTFAESIVADLPDPVSHLRRIGLLVPLYRIKWSCILLNEFLRSGEERRLFAMSSDPASRRAVQLGKAKTMLGSLHQTVLQLT
jgi:hypothetical protein